MPDPPQAEYNVVDQAGEHVGKVAAGEVENLPRGLRVATNTETAGIEAQAKYGGIGSQAKAAALGLLHGPTAGLSTAALAALGGEGVRKEIKALRRYSPGAFTAGEIVGGIAGLAVPFSPVAKMAKIGRAVEAAAAARGIGAAGRLAAGAAAEGALYGAGEGIANLALDNELNGEKLAVSILAGTLAGGSIGYGLGKGAQALRGARSRLVAALNRPGADAAGAAVGKGAAVGRRFTNAFADLSAVASGTDSGAARAMMAFDETGRAFRRNAVDAEPIRRSLTEQLTTQIDRGQGSLDELMEYIKNMSMKKSAMRGLFDDSNAAQAAIRSGEQFDNVLSRLDEMVGNKATYNQTGVKDLRNAAKGIRDKMDTAVKAAATGRDETREMFRHLDRLKREIGKYRARLERVQMVSEQQLNKKIAYDAMFDGADGAVGLRRTLEDSSVWGKAGAVQKEINAHIFDFLSTNKRFSREFLTKYGRSKRNPFRDAHVANPAALTNFVGSMGLPKNQIAERAMRETLANQVKTAKSMLKHFEMSPTAKKAAVEFQESAEAAIRHMAEASDSVTAGNMLGALAPGERGIGGLALTAGAAAVGGMIGDSEGAGIATLVAGALTNPARVVRQIAAVERMAARVSTKVTKSVTALTKPKGPALGSMIAMASKPRKRRKERREEFEGKAAAVEQASLPSHHDELQALLDYVGTGAPKAQVAALAAQQRAVKFLRDKMPAFGLAAHPLGVPSAPSQVEVDRWLRMTRAIEDPTTLLDDMTRGMVSHDAVDAVKSVYPALFADIQNQVMDRLIEIDESGQSLPYQRRKAIGALLDVPADATMQPHMIAAFQASYQPQKGEPKPQRPAPSRAKPMAGDYATRTQKREMS